MKLTGFRHNYQFYKVRQFQSVTKLQQSASYIYFSKGLHIEITSGQMKIDDINQTITILANDL